MAEEADIGVSGHMVMLERREAVNRAIERFLAGEGQVSWRDSSQVKHKKAGTRETLQAERPWLAHYEKGVPFTVSVPRIPLHHLLRSAVRRFPNRAAVYFEGSRLSYRDLNHQANRFANALLALGVGRGARVVLLLPNVPQMVVGFYGALKAGMVAVFMPPMTDPEDKAGMVAVFMPPMTDPEELVRQVRDADASVLVTLNLSAGLAKQIQASTGLPHIILTDPADYLSVWKKMISRWRNRGLTAFGGAIRWRHFMLAQDWRSPTLEVDPDELAVIQYTGGTTAAAKGVMLSHKNLVANALQTRHWMPAAVEGQERFLCVLPFSHSYGLTTALNVPIALGAALVSPACRTCT